MSRNRNPYEKIDWKNQIRVTGATHLHCDTREQFEIATGTGLEFATFSNYYPSTPYYPAASMHKNSTKLGQKGFVQNGVYHSEAIDWRKKFAEWGEDTSIFPADEGERLFPEIPAGFMEAPNAEHHCFSDYNVYLHITAPGSFYSSGNFYRNRGTVLDKYGIRMGTAMPWRDAFQAMIDNLLIPDGGGIIINHPSWSHLPLHFMQEMLDFDEDRVLGLEAVNVDANVEYIADSESQWDELLGTGRQCYGFCTQDHLGTNRLLGRSILLPEERSVEGCLRAYRQGRFYGAIRGEGLNFESIEFDGKTLRVRCDKEAIMLLITHQGVEIELWTGRELVYTVKESERAKHMFLRVTAVDQASGEKLFTQPMMLV